MLLIIMCGAIFLGVVFRYLLHLPLSWAEELSRISFIWLVFLGSSLVAKRGDHIRMEVLPASVPPILRKKVRAASQIAVVVTLLILIWSGSRLALSSWNTPTSMLQISWGLVYLAIPLGSVLTLIRLFQAWKRGTESPDGNEGAVDRW